MAALSKSKMIHEHGFKVCERMAQLDQQGFTASDIIKTLEGAKNMTKQQVKKCIEAYYDRVQS